MPRYKQLTPQIQVIKRQIATVLHTDDERATIKAVADYLGVFYRSLMSKTHDPHTIENSHIVSASTLQPPGYTPAELVLYNFNPGSRVWHPGLDFNQHMDTRLQQLFPAPPGCLHSYSGAGLPAPDTASGNPQTPGAASTLAVAIPVAPLAANPDLTALLQPVVYLYRGSNYPISGVLSLVDAGPLYQSGIIVIDLYTHIYNHHGDDPKLVQWIRDHIPPANQPEFVGCWKLATKQVKAAQAGWENAGRRGEELPPVPEIGLGYKRDIGESTDPGIIAIGVALDKAEELRVRAVETRAAAVLNLNQA